MFNDKYNYTNLKCKDFVGDPDKTLPDHQYIIKTKTIDSKPYLIHLDEFNDTYFFIKFHPSKYSGSPDKYKIRIGHEYLPVRIMTTCVNVIQEKIEKNPDACFGLFGQWDEIDVNNQSEISQRFRIWKRIAVSKFDDKKYKFLTIEPLNVLLMIPTHIYSDEFLRDTQDYFYQRFENKIQELRIPRKKDYYAYQAN